MLEKTLESPLYCKEIQPVHPKGDQSWVFVGRTDVEAETPILWPPDVKSWLIRKDPDAGKDWRQEEKGTTEDEMLGWYHRLNGHEFGSAVGDVMIGRPGVQWSMGSKRVGHDWETELNWCGIFPNQGSAVFPESAGRFFTSELQGSPWRKILKEDNQLLSVC